MLLEGWITIAVVTGIIGILIFTHIAADAAFIGGLTVLIVLGILSPKDAFAGFGNEGLVTIAVLYIVVTGVRETGGIQWVVHNVLGRPRSLPHAQVRTLLPASILSGFINNTPLVAMMVPALNSWAKKFQLPPSKLLLPMNYATILGGTCTLIGTSTNLVVSGMLVNEGVQLGMFSIAWVGLPVAIAGLIFLLIASGRLLPDRRANLGQLSNPREYSVEMLVEPGSPLVGKSIEEAGLRQLPGLYLAEIDREGAILPAVSRHERLRASDRLIFFGVVDSVVELRKIRGLMPATDQLFKLDGSPMERGLIEAVVSNTGPLVGRSVREAAFRSRYNAVVIAVARSGKRINQKIGDIVLEPGDTLMLEGRPSFLEEYRNSRDFFLVSEVQDSAPLRHEKATISVTILAAMIIAATTGVLSMLESAMLAAAAMIGTRCCTITSARRSIEWPVLIVIGSAFGVGAALQQSGAAPAIAQFLLDFTHASPWSTMVAIYVATVIFTNLITNNAAAVLMFPFALNIAGDLNVSFMPFAIAIMMGASSSYATPIGYQTNLMVMGPGGYRFSDYFRLGIPLTVVAGIITVVTIPMVWAF